MRPVNLFMLINSLSTRLILSSLIFFSICLVGTTSVSASTTDGAIDSVNRYAWSENAGWIDFGSSQGNVHVTDSALTGYAWGENVGWVSLNCTNDSSCGTASYGVSNTTEGTLSGYAWSENAGWIQFNPTGGGVTIDASGNFAGEAWGENVGWIVFNCATTSSCATVSYSVATDWRPTSSRPSATSTDAATPSGGHSGGHRGSNFVPPPSPFLSQPSVSFYSSSVSSFSSRSSSSSPWSRVFDDVPPSSWFST